MDNSFETLKRDFDSCQLPDAYDPMTLKTLCKIIDSIQKGETTLAEFEDYLAKNHMELTPLSQRKPALFGDICYSFVSDVLKYFDAKTR